MNVTLLNNGNKLEAIQRERDHREKAVTLKNTSTTHGDLSYNSRQSVC